MTLSNAEVVSRFLDGEADVRSGSLGIVEGDNGYTVLTGYNACGYAARNPSGKLVVFGGWANRAVAADVPEDRRGFNDPYENAGSHTTKAKHFTEIPWRDADILVAYDAVDTELEQTMIELADVVTDDPEYAAPKPLEAATIARDLILPPAD